MTSKGLYRQKEDSKDIEFEEEYNYSKDYNELKSLGYWVHLHPALCKIGRCSHYVDPSLSTEEKDAYLANLGEVDPEIERLKGIEEEKSPFPIPEVFKKIFYMDFRDKKTLRIQIGLSKNVEIIKLII